MKGIYTLQRSCCSVWHISPIVLLYEVFVLLFVVGLVYHCLVSQRSVLLGQIQAEHFHT